MTIFYCLTTLGVAQLLTSDCGKNWNAYDVNNQWLHSNDPLLFPVGLEAVGLVWHGTFTVEYIPMFRVRMKGQSLLDRSGSVRLFMWDAVVRTICMCIHNNVS
jgi:hypothetical protein